MRNDEEWVGRLLTRREALKLLGIAGAAMLSGCAPGQAGSGQPPSATPGPNLTNVAGALPACVVRPALTEGPYYVDEELNRSDIRSDPASGAVKDGAPLNLIFRVSQIGEGSCTPLEGARVDVWHCDAGGVYSDVVDPGFDATGQKFLRGYQLTDDLGQATFLTIYPGWYSGRTVHIHFKIIHEATTQSYVFTSQLFFDDGLSDQVFSQEPYASRGSRNVRNNNDGIFNQQMLLPIATAGQGYSGTFDIGLQIA